MHLLQVQCNVEWSITQNNRTYVNSSTSDLRYKIIDRPDLVDTYSVLIEKESKHDPPLTNYPLTIKCIAPTCQFSTIYLQKDSYQVKFDMDKGIVRNDFNATAGTDNTSSHVEVWLKFDKASREDSGKYVCLGIDNDIEPDARPELDILLEPARIPAFDLFENYTDKVSWFAFLASTRLHARSLHLHSAVQCAMQFSKLQCADKLCIVF